MTRTLFTGATLLLPDGPVQDGWLLVDRGRIAALGRGTPPGESAMRIDAKGRALAPGFVDVHAHGALGHDTMDATPTALQAMARHYAAHGVTGFLATTMAAPAADIMAALDNVARVMASADSRSPDTQGAALLGAHVEGPYLDLARRGAQGAAHVRPADPAEYMALFDTGIVRLITLAPEFPPNRELVRYAIAHGVVVAAAHSRATCEQMMQAVDDGVTQVTHLFNGMEPLHHREPGVVGAALSMDELYCQLIADNIHIHPAVLRLAVRAKTPERIVLVTDAMAGTGMPDGEYVLGDAPVTVREGIARNADGALAGSTLTLDRAVANIMAATGLPLHQAVRMAGQVPARSLGMWDRGILEKGAAADLVLLDDGPEVALTMVGGRIVFQR
jgi:N-acetylglucosamine-6-phosphate deacetylase